jgi:hypothetical protein
MAPRLGKKKAIVAIQHSILIAVWHMLTDDALQIGVALAGFAAAGHRPGLHGSRAQLGPRRQVTRRGLRTGLCWGAVYVELRRRVRG